eukprot:TRINITY_DN14508_c0_g3_i1.p1 TRINITY_DN14508_c0_g3~~TRINITY_DN14508_c0_g3_i1.p1  ORF type:complete len:666 (-),score=125.47 TRINITY_DN14508_c0_g3_i1:59-2008(-)
MSDSDGDEEAPARAPKKHVLKRQRTYDSHFHKKHVVLEVRNATFSVKGPGGQKKILDDVSLLAESGESTALMGPSGAGKTTFLDFINLGLKGGKATGRVQLNRQPLTFETFRRQAVYVEQYDTHWAFLTCEETMRFAASLYLPGDRREQNERVEKVMEKLGLLECKDTYAGNDFFKGMSGGQRKRLTLGVALLKAPVLMLLDEPTSGLDAASTASVMAALKDMCAECNLIAIATIHQPSRDVFMGFSKVMFLANGRTAYCGETNRVSDYCAEIGLPLPPHTNPANYFIELINSEFKGREEVDRIVNKWGNRHAKDYAGTLEPLPRGIQLKGRQQFCTILSRQLLLSVRDPTLYLGRMAAFLIANTFFAIVYWKARPREQDYVHPRMFLLGWFVSVPTMLSIICVFAANEEFNMVRKEIKNGLVKTGSFLTASSIVTLPYMVLLALFAFVLPCMLSRMNFTYFPSTIALFSTTLWSYECIAQCMGAVFKGANLGMLAALGVWFMSFLFMGTFLQESLIIWPFKALVKMFPLKWTGQALFWNEFYGTEWEGAIETDLSPVGFFCPDVPMMKCSGATGEQVLKTLSWQFSNVTPEDTRLQSALIVFSIGLFFKVIQIATVIAKSRAVRVIKEADDSSGLLGSIREDSDSESD